MRSNLLKIVSGGQTGVDRAALDAAIFHDIPHGGWCPLGRRSEDGKIPATYQLTETDSRNYAVRTEQNVRDSDGTLILFEDFMSRGTELTAKLTRKLRRPLFKVDISGLCDWDDETFDQEIGSVVDWIEQLNIGVLNVAGPRESSAIGIGSAAQAFLVRLFER